MPAVDDIRPVPTGEPELDRPMILAQPAGGEELGEFVSAES